MFRNFEIFNFLKSWNLEILKSWDLDFLKSWNVENLKSWNLEILKCWTDEMVKGWKIEMLRCSHVDVLDYCVMLLRCGAVVRAAWAAVIAVVVVIVVAAVVVGCCCWSYCGSSSASTSGSRSSSGSSSSGRYWRVVSHVGCRCGAKRSLWHCLPIWWSSHNSRAVTITLSVSVLQTGRCDIAFTCHEVVMPPTTRWLHITGLSIRKIRMPCGWGSRLQSFKLSRFQDFKISRFQDFTKSRFQDLKISRFQDFKVSRFPYSREVQLFALSGFPQALRTVCESQYLTDA